MIYSIDNLTGSIVSLVSFEGHFLISCGSTGKISYWNLNTYTEVLTNNAVAYPISMVANDYIIAFTTGKCLHVMRNPLFHDKISAFGPDESLKYTFMEYCVQFLDLSIPEYDERMDK